MGERFLGTASIIHSDSDGRPDLGPWLAAVWVETDARERGVGAALVERAADNAFGLGINRLYLQAGHLRRPFYEKRGWRAHEESVGTKGLKILRKDALGG
jgi:GNAT superfamily N-acetyltransferase